jgi:hypothetical protein
LRSVHVDGGRWFAELEGPTPSRAELHFATRELPLAHRGPVIHRRVAELIAPAVVPETTLSVLPWGELSRATREPRSRKLLAKTVRVLGDGSVRAALVAAPPLGLAKVDFTDELEGGAVFGWESALVRRETPADAARAGLAAYQAVLVVDHLVQNLRRQQVLLAEGGGALLAVQGNDAFTPQPVEGALANPLERLARHVTYSATLVERLRAVDRERLAQALHSGRDDEILVTQKELDQILERKRGLEKLVEGLVARRGASKALALP